MRRMGKTVKKITIKDVAKEAGVSITTVSHALSGGGALKQETRDRVMEIARQMQYMPDWNGRNLKSVKTKTIGLFTEYIRGYYGLLADCMCEMCWTNGYELDVILTDNEESLMRNLLSRRVDGAVILHDGFSTQNVETLLKAEVPTVFLDREISGKSVSSVLFDSYQTGRMAAEYLYSLGHRRMMLVEGKDTYDGNERRRGFCDFLEKKGVPLEDAYRIKGSFDQRIAYEATVNFLKQGLTLPDAIFAANDDSAFGCIKALTGAGYSVPEQISIIGCDDIELSKWYTPALTTVHVNVEKQGADTAARLVELIEGRQQGRVEKIEGRIVERSSCRPKREIL